MWARLRDDTGWRRAALALGLYLLTTSVYFACAARNTLTAHTPWNHFALLADAWLHGRLDLGHPPPAYAGNNDFASYQGRWYVTFPPFPSVLLLPAVAVAGSAERVRDGQIFLWLAGVGPAMLFLALERLRFTGRGGRSTRGNLALALLFAFGTVYFFTAEQGTVWFSAHVVAVALAALYLWAALDAAHPLVAGVALGLGFATRSPLLFAAPLFIFESLRVALRSPEAMAGEVRRSGERTELHRWWRRLDHGRVFRAWLWFALPVALVLGATLWHNAARFGDPFEFGYRFLTVGWRGRIEKYGLFDYHFLAKNLGVVLTSLPYRLEPPEPAPFQINAHGLALWVTTPLYLWLLWPRRFASLSLALWVTVAAVAVPTLFYQNTGWVQFGYRFSNDYAVFLFALLALGGRRFGALFTSAAVWSVAINAFGAVSFNRAGFARFYFQDHTQRELYQRD
ncbi:MAG: hypothetical protein OZ921_01895 [Sorangiineae bacterium]|nr:hypothetical protein [Polyangiaceae bacterium]MEB2321236.1 hypothetical protein [Sorangiineae bacterium]